MQDNQQTFFVALSLLGQKHTTADLSAMLGVQPSVLSRWRTGARTPRGPSRAAVQVLAHLQQNHPDVYEEVRQVRLRSRPQKGQFD